MKVQSRLGRGFSYREKSNTCPALCRTVNRPTHDNKTPEKPGQGCVLYILCVFDCRDCYQHGNKSGKQKRATAAVVVTGFHTQWPPDCRRQYIIQ